MLDPTTYNTYDIDATSPKRPFFIALLDTMSREKSKKAKHYGTQSTLILEGGLTNTD